MPLRPPDSLRRPFAFVPCATRGAKFRLAASIIDGMDAEPFMTAANEK